MSRLLLATVVVILTVLGGWLILRDDDSTRQNERAPEETSEKTQSLIEWESLVQGLDLAELQLPMPSCFGDRKVRVVRVDPKRFKLLLRTASRDGQSRPLPEWADTVDPRLAVVVTNAAMYETDDITSAGLMQDGEHVNNAKIAADQNSIVVASPVSSADPAFRIANLGCEELDSLRSRYHLLVQSIRMLDCDGTNIWAQQTKMWSAALIGQDRDGRLLFMHVRSPYTMHDLVNQLKALPLDIVALHYCDGGPPAGLYLRSGKTKHLWLGSYETRIQEDDNNDLAWAIPNVLMAVERR